MKRTKKRASDPDWCRLRIYPLSQGKWVGRITMGDTQIGNTRSFLSLEDVCVAALNQGFEPDMVIEHRDAERGTTTFSIGRVNAALAGTLDANQLSADERSIFDDLLGEAMDRNSPKTPSETEFWTSFDRSRSTDDDDMDNAEFNHLLSKARDASAGGRDAWSVQSTGEKLAVALALNQFDWLQAMDYTIAEAIERVGPEWVGMIPSVARTLRDESSL